MDKNYNDLLKDIINLLTNSKTNLRDLSNELLKELNNIENKENSYILRKSKNNK